MAERPGIPLEADVLEEALALESELKRLIEKPQLQPEPHRSAIDDWLESAYRETWRYE